VHRQMTLGLLGEQTPEDVVRQWFAWFQAAFLLGAAAGGGLFGWLGDRIGRSRALGASVLCYSLFTLACYLAATAEVMIALRFLACLGIGGVWPNAVALVAEAWPDASRPFLAGLLGTAANVGFVLLGVVTLGFPVAKDAWRWALLVGAAPGVIGLTILLLVPESPRWLAGRAAKPAGAGTASPLRDLLPPPLLSRPILAPAPPAIAAARS